MSQDNERMMIRLYIIYKKAWGKSLTIARMLLNIQILTETK